MLASRLAEAGFECELVDLSVFGKAPFETARAQIVERLTRAGGDVYCLSPCTASYSVAKLVAQWIRTAVRCNASIVVGGCHATNFSTRCIEDGFDVAVRGRGEQIIVRLITALLGGHAPEAIPGIVYRFSRDVIVATPNPLATKQDGVPFRSDFSILPDDFVIDVLRVFTSHGCPFRCAFCADVIWARRSPVLKNMVSFFGEIEELLTRFGPKPVLIGDETFTVSRKRVLDVCSGMAARQIQWFCRTRVDLVDDELLSIMAESGCRLVHFGAETSDTALLKLLDKRVDPDMVERACLAAKRAGLRVITYWMAGVPGETRLTALRTQEKICALIEEGLTDYADYYICVPYPGTDIYANPQKYNVEIIHKDFSEWREDQPSVMKTLALDENQIFEIWSDGIERITSSTLLP